MRLPLIIRKNMAKAGAFMLEKAYGSGTWLQPGGSASAHHDLPWNFWQADMDPGTDVGGFGPVATSINTISQDLAKVPLMHYRVLPDGRREVVTNKAPARIFRRPNHFQSRVDWMLYLTASLLSEGNGYCAAIRNDRGEVNELYPLPSRSIYPYLTPDGELVYSCGRSEWTDITMGALDVDRYQWLPPRDVLHVRLQTPAHPLIGETMLVAAVDPAEAGARINQHNATFFRNMSRPSGVLRHPGTLDPKALERIKERWREITTSGRVGEVPVLQENMDWKPLTMTAVDAELARSYQMSERQIFQIFRIPPFMYGDIDRVTGLQAEPLIRFYVQTCLSYYVSYIETALTQFFRLPPDEYIEFDIEQSLLRGDLKERMEAYGKATQNGVFAPNEARLRENLPPVEHGDQPRVQQQLVPLAYGVQQQSVPAPAPAPAPEPAPESSPEDEERLIDEYHKRLIA